MDNRLTASEINYIAGYWRSRPNRDEIDFMVPNQEAADQLRAAITRYFEHHGLDNPPKPVEDPFLNHYL